MNIFDLGHFSHLQQPGGLMYDFSTKRDPKKDNEISLLDLIFSGEKVPDMAGKYGSAKDMSSHATIGKLLANMNQMRRATPKKKVAPLYNSPYLVNLLGG